MLLLGFLEAIPPTILRVDLAWMFELLWNKWKLEEGLEVNNTAVLLLSVWFSVLESVVETLSDCVTDLAEPIVETLAGVSDVVDSVVRTLEKAAVVLVLDLVEI